MKSKENDTCPELLISSTIVRGAKTLIFDRDGTINVDNGYVHKITEFAFTQQFVLLAPILEKFKGNICIITNQGGVRLGMYSKNESQEFTRYVISKAKEKGIIVNLVAICYHHDKDSCDSRKPASGMLQKIEEVTESNRDRYLYIGNEKKDEEVARKRNINYRDINSEKLESFLVEWVRNP